MENLENLLKLVDKEKSKIISELIIIYTAKINNNSNAELIEIIMEDFAAKLKKVITVY